MTGNSTHKVAPPSSGTFSAQAVAALSRPVATAASRAAQFGLSEREADVMEQVARGAANTAIARELYISEKTVKNYVSSLLHKLGFDRRTEAGVYAARRRRTHPGSF